MNLIQILNLAKVASIIDRFFDDLEEKLAADGGILRKIDITITPDQGYNITLALPLYMDPPEPYKDIRYTWRLYYVNGEHYKWFITGIVDESATYSFEEVMQLLCIEIQKVYKEYKSQN